ncbi:unnamed protein product [Blepharisma stoltei]|uniref:Transmembrane protein n=1 Tax=Blepharisma stoltei TaxID=1481888 RepID=A0AAU9JJB8_9CILI|nr:unnamed protein product [Blepharisma stoltei]
MINYYLGVVIIILKKDIKFAEDKNYLYNIQALLYLKPIHQCRRKLPKISAYFAQSKIFLSCNEIPLLSTSKNSLSSQFPQSKSSILLQTLTFLFQFSLILLNNLSIIYHPTF